MAAFDPFRTLVVNTLPTAFALNITGPLEIMGMIFLALALAAIAGDDKAVALRALTDDQWCASLTSYLASRPAQKQSDQVLADCSSKRLRVIGGVPADVKPSVFVKKLTRMGRRDVCESNSPVMVEFVRRGWRYEYDTTFGDGSSRVTLINCGSN